MLNKACQNFLKFHSENRHVYDLFEKFTFEVIQSGRRNFGVKSIIERIRWETNITSQNSFFKINNNYAPFYARMFEAKYPTYKGFFRKRRAAADVLASVTIHHPQNEN